MSLEASRLLALSALERGLAPLKGSDLERCLRQLATARDTLPLLTLHKWGACLRWGDAQTTCYADRRDAFKGDDVVQLSVQRGDLGAIQTFMWPCDTEEARLALSVPV